MDPVTATPPDLNAFWYTYSTVAQTLAALFGLLFAAYVFRMNAFDVEQQRRLAEYLEAAEKDPPDHTALATNVSKHRRECSSIEGVASETRRAFQWTAGTIAACLGLMPLTPWIVWLFGLRVAYLPLIAVIAAAARCLWKYREIVLVILPEPEP